MRKRVVIIGMGDSGLLSAIHLSGYVDVVGISTKACMLSGQELGLRLSRPAAWLPVSMIDFQQYRRLDGVEILHGRAQRIDPAARRVHVALATGATREVAYDALLIASGVRNGFWRTDQVESREAAEAAIQEQAARIAAAATLAVVGGGPSSVSTAANVKRRYPDKAVHLFFSREQVLPGYHAATRADAMARLQADGVVLHPGHRAVVAPDFFGEMMSSEPIRWQSGQPPFTADLVVWALGRVRPNSGFLPANMLDDSGFVVVDRFLRVAGHEAVFAVGDIAATDPHRSSARNQGHRTVVRNIRALLLGRPRRMAAFKTPPAHRWGSIFGVQREGLRVYAPSGWALTIGPWLTTWVLFRLIVAELIYKGIRRLDPRAFRDMR